MKKFIFALFLLLMVGIFIYPTFAYADTNLSIPHRFAAYESPSLTSKKVAEFDSQTVTVIQTQGSYWYQIETAKHGNKWVYYNPNLGSKELDYRVKAFESPSFSSDYVHSFDPQTVQVTAQHGNFYQIETTNYGLAWIYYDKVSIPHKFTIYDTTSFSSGALFTYDAQTVRVVEKSGNYWYLIHTETYGDKWMYHNPNLGSKELDYRVKAFESPSFTSDYVHSFDPQTVQVTAQHGNFYQIETTKYGLAWIYYDKVSIPHKFTIYDTTSFSSGALFTYDAQTVRVVEKSGNYWYLIHTETYGDKWMYHNPNLGSLSIPYRFNGYEAPTTSSTRVSSFSSQTVNITAKTGNWYEFETSSFGNLWVYYDGSGGSSSLIVPLEGSYDINSRYGSRSGGFHYGIDLDQDGTAKILASADGTVERANYSSSYGYVVYVYHPSLNLTTVYAHMRSNLQVSLGQTVSQGQTLGYMGNTGDSSGQHLHFEVHGGDWDYHGGLNPENYIDF
ncbi:peptidoglycan DD-metalloendopeptidase family protein [Gracilibacillus sp. D59]|uniref:peptidoglycan DD-metalloendopeptidase family protein n=1 Tax=Gracilibacillus sp. D59 TaxID=3457434 RepID=UPI003FCCABEF